jgi:hypothetical protein
VIEEEPHALEAAEARTSPQVGGSCTGTGLSDDDVIASLVADASERDLAALLHEFPRDSAFVLAIYAQFLERGSTWSEPLRAQLADALARCRLPDEADIVRDS